MCQPMGYSTVYCSIARHVVYILGSVGPAILVDGRQGRDGTVYAVNLRVRQGSPMKDRRGPARGLPHARATPAGDEGDEQEAGYERGRGDGGRDASVAG